MSKQPSLLPLSILILLMASGRAAVAAPYTEAPENPDAARAFEFLLDKDFSRQCDLTTSVLRDNLDELFGSRYMGLEFERWEVEEGGTGEYLLTLHYNDERSGTTEARWTVRPEREEARMDGESAEVVSCF
ncbi:MAG: hypothetical protein ACLFRB_07205 [Thiohalorhabdus sp.]|uniref:hypothetical protein n=1 Tax=Thiohalorhabdus sp. TaxID=3094134 RepID=UPI0039809DD2